MLSKPDPDLMARALFARSTLCATIGRHVPADTLVLGCNNDLTEARTAEAEPSSIDLNSERIG